MKKNLTIICSCFIIMLIAVSAQAKIVSVSGPNSSSGYAPAIISPPSDILDGCVTNLGMQGFDEAQSITTTESYDTDIGPIPAGTTVSSHMIFLNLTPGGPTSLAHNLVNWTFDQPIIGVMSDMDGTMEAASTHELGAPGTNYTIVPTAPDTTSCGTNTITYPSEKAAPFNARGLENAAACTSNSADGYNLSGDTITVCMWVAQPGDWIRVITLATIGVEIDIKPGSDPNSINLCSNGAVPIAIMGSTEFDVFDVNTDTLRFAEAAVKIVGKKDPHSLCNYEDVNGDGFDDLVCHFLTADIAGIDGESTSATVNGELIDGTPIEGTDIINIVKDSCN